MLLLFCGLKYSCMFFLHITGSDLHIIQLSSMLGGASLLLVVLGIVLVLCLVEQKQKHEAKLRHESSSISMRFGNSKHEYACSKIQ